MRKSCIEKTSVLKKQNSDCNAQLAAYILEVGQCLDCLKRRPVSYYNLYISFYSQNGLLKGLFIRLRRFLELQLRGDVQALSKFGHVPQACKKLMRKFLTFLRLRTYYQGPKTGVFAKVHFIEGIRYKIETY